MNSIGILQGRILPERLDRLQVFPASRWELELAEIASVGFDFVELLYDKELICRRLCFDAPDTRAPLRIHSLAGRPPLARSMCVDYLASLSALSVPAVFLQHLGDLIESLARTTVETLVIPFCDANHIQDRRSLEKVLASLEEAGLGYRARERGLCLALEIPLPASEILLAFSRFKSFEYQLCFDLGNASAMGLKPEREILELGTRLRHVHVKDRAADGQNVLLGDGLVDFGACFRALRETGYSGPLVLETAYFTNPRAEALRNLEFVNKALMAVTS
jgi:sugar phosphate isomerase/epimerase